MEDPQQRIEYLCNSDDKDGDDDDCDNGDYDDDDDDCDNDDYDDDEDDDEDIDNRSEYLLAMKSNGKFSGNANDDISPIDGLYNKSNASISGKRSPDNKVDGALAIAFLLLLLLLSLLLLLFLPILNKLSIVW